MAEPITVPIVTDPNVLADIAYSRLEANIPGWERGRADWASQLIDSCAQLIAEGRDTASDVPLDVIAYLGKWLVQLPAIQASQASVNATVTAVDNAGYTIDAGTRFLVKTAGDDGVIFTAVTPVTIPPGSTATATGGVQLLAADPGADGSNLPADSVVVPVDALAWISTVTLTGITTGGEDAETVENYLTRLVEEFALFTPTPILPTDFSALALRVPGVGRTLALNLYNPSDGLYTHARTVTVAVTDNAGEPVSTDVKTAVSDYLESLREVNWTVPVIDATYTTIKVTFTAVAQPGYDPAAVELLAKAAVAAYLSPGNWGQPFYQEDSLVTWVNDPIVRYLEIAEVINRVDGLHYISALSFAKSTDSLAGTDVTLTGPAPLTRPGVINGTVSAAP